MRQPTTAEVRFDEHKAASFGPVGPSILPFWLSTSRLRSNFVAADPPATEDQVQQAGNPENVGLTSVPGRFDHFLINPYPGFLMFTVFTPGRGVDGF
jgi:hypothetical protein